MASWTEGNNPNIASVLTHSGDYTYPKGDNPNICGGVPLECAKTVELNYKIPLDPWYNTTATKELISKASDSYSCNHEMLVMWFNDKGTNKSYPEILSSAQGNFVIKNVDECTHVMERTVSGDNGSPQFVFGTQVNFEDSSYIDSGFPRIKVEPWKSDTSCNKYSGQTYGHKIKYMPVTDTIGDGTNSCVGYNPNLVELYFPDYGNTTETSGKTTREISVFAFEGNVNLSAVTFSAVQIIHEQAFYNCSGLTHIDWGNCCGGSQLTHIYNSAFYNCNKLRHICLGRAENLEYIGTDAFNGIGSSISTSSQNPIMVEIPESVSAISSNAFTTTANLVFKLNWTLEELRAPNRVNLTPTSFGRGSIVICPPINDFETYKTELVNKGINVDSSPFSDCEHWERYV
jgi:hypothetical protein